MNRFLEKGYNVVGNSRTVSASTHLTASPRLALVDGDIGDSTTTQKITDTAIERFGRIDVLVKQCWLLDDRATEIRGYVNRHHVAAAYQSLRAILASELEARVLDLQIGEPVMLVKGVTYPEDGRAIEVEESHFRAEAIEFIIELGEYSQYAPLMSHDLLQRRKSVPSKAIALTVRR